jgi:hypothetical protein
MEKIYFFFQGGWTADVQPPLQGWARMNANHGIISQGIPLPRSGHHAPGFVAERHKNHELT